MKAAQISEYGSPDVIQIVEIATPQPGPDQILVEVHAASLNPFDTKIREGAMRETIPLQFPLTLGGDIAGVVSEVGEGVTDLAAGDRVYGQSQAVAGDSGAFAEFAVSKANHIGKAPANLDFAEIAALPLVGVSALQSLTDHLNLQAGQKIFIHGGAGGIGTIAIQIAKHLGAYVATTAAGDGVDYVKNLGADEVIDYKTQDFTQILHDYDAVFDLVGGDEFTRTLGVLRDGGSAVSMTAPPDEALVEQKHLTALTQSTRVTTKRLDALRELVESGVVTPHVDKTFSLDDAREAFVARETGDVKGKVVLTVR